VKENLEKSFVYHFDSFFTPEALNTLIDISHSGTYEEYTYTGEGDTKDIGKELILNQRHQLKFSMIMKNKELYKFINQLLPKVEITNFSGRVYKLSQGSYSLDWHQDSRDATRVLAISINLSKDDYNSKTNGGEFCIRKVNEPESIQVFRSDLAGQATIFSVKPGMLEHSVRSIIGEGDRVVLAGWFRVDS
jgi:Rps23 Pro-64 3,4-dihydroxylase Tpa1-like proline 4-hydroxylase